MCLTCSAWLAYALCLVLGARLALGYWLVGIWTLPRTRNGDGWLVGGWGEGCGYVGRRMWGGGGVAGWCGEECRAGVCGWVAGECGGVGVGWGVCVRVNMVRDAVCVCGML